MRKKTGVIHIRTTKTRANKLKRYAKIQGKTLTSVIEKVIDEALKEESNKHKN